MAMPGAYTTQCWLHRAAVLGCTLSGGCTVIAYRGGGGDDDVRGCDASGDCDGDAASDGDLDGGGLMEGWKPWCMGGVVLGRAWRRLVDAPGRGEQLSTDTHGFKSNNIY